MTTLTRPLATLSTKYPVATVVVAVLLSLLSLWHAKTHIRFDTNQDHLISDKQQYLVDYTGFLKEFGDWEYIYVVVKVPPQEQATARRFADALTAKLKTRPDLYEKITHRIDMQHLKKGLSLFASDADCKKFVGFVAENQPVLSQFLSVKSSADWYGFLNRVLQSRSSLADTGARDKLEKLWPFLKDSINAPFDKTALHTLQDTNLFTLLGDRYMDPEGYLFSENGRLLFIRILPVKNFESMEIIAEPIKGLRSQIAGLRPQFTGLEIGITGRPVLQNDEATSTQSDSALAGIGSFLLVALLCFVFFRGFRRSLYSLFALAVSICLTMGFISVTFGTINLISIVFAIILIGVGIDYGIHLLIRYQEERIQGHDTTQAITAATQHTGSAIIAGAITTAIAFATAIFTDFLGLQQLGIIAGVGVIICCVVQLTVFPALLKLFDRKPPPSSYGIPAFERLSFLVKHPRLVLFTALMITLLCIPLSLRTGFNNNLLSLQDQNLESVRFEKIIQDNSDFSTWFLAYKTRDMVVLRDLKSRIESLPSVKRTESIGDLIPADQGDRIRGIRKVAQTLLPVPTADRDLRTAMGELQATLLGLSREAFASGLADEFAELDGVVRALASHYNLLPQDGGLPPFERGFLEVIKSLQDLMRATLDPQPLTEDTIPKGLLEIYKGKNGFYSLSIYPRENIWDPQHMERFISEVRSIIPDVTGAPVTHFESAKRMLSGFILVSVLTSLLVIVIMYAQFKKIGVSLLVFVNLCVTFIWLAACMYMCGVQINLANFFAVPILIGTGMDSGIHILHRYRETGSVDDLFTSAVPAVILSCLTTLFGFGALALVRHNGLASFGLIITLGTTLIMIASIVVLPNLVRWMEKRE